MATMATATTESVEECRITEEYEALILQAQLTTDKAEQELTMQAYKRKILQIQRWLRANGHNVDFFEERAGGIVLKSKPSADQLRAFWESKKKNKPDIRRKTLEAFRSAINKYIEVQSETPDNTVVPYTDKELKWLKRWLDGFRNETSLNIREGIISGVEGKREMTPDEFIKLAYHTMTTQCLPVQQNDSAPPAQQHDAPASAQQHDSATQRRGKKKKQPRSRCPTELPLFTTLGWNLCARLDTSSSVTTLWRKWWIGEPGNCMPYRIVFASYKSDMQAALEFENEDDANLKKKKQILRATMNEHTKVMEHITSFASSEHLTALHGYNAADLRTKVAFQEEIQLTWNALWPKYEQQVGFAAVWRGVTQGGKSGKRRQHDLKRTTVRTAYRLYLDQKKYIESQ